MGKYEISENFERILRFIFKFVLLIVWFVAPLLFWYFFFTSEYSGAVLFYAVVTTICSYGFIRYVLFEDSDKI